jgi:hypothetical protein
MTAGALHAAKHHGAQSAGPVGTRMRSKGERGANAVQVQRWLGHHSAAFALATSMCTS